jgi:hypothetical protein
MALRPGDAEELAADVAGRGGVARAVSGPTVSIGLNRQASLSVSKLAGVTWLSGE